MLFALPWTIPFFGQVTTFDVRSFKALTGGILVCLAVGGILLFLGRKAVLFDIFSDKNNNQARPYNPDDMYDDSPKETPKTSSTVPRREAIAIVGLSWILAGILGMLPFWFAQVARDDSKEPQIPTSAVDYLFESFSGVTGFGATVFNNLENPEYMPKAILFWRSELHFLGGLGIMVLFVAILGGQSAGKSLMQTEMPRSSNEIIFAQARNTAMALLTVYLVLNTVLFILLIIEGMSIYDALCHAFSCVATGGFSTRDHSIAHYNSFWIELTIAIFMFISSCNFALLYLALTWEKKRIDLISSSDNGRVKTEFGIFKLLNNTEFRVFVGILLIATVFVSGSCWIKGDFAADKNAQTLTWSSLCDSVRYGGFQVLTIVSSAGFSSYDYEKWNDMSRVVLFILMFCGGCVGSTTCGLKTMRLIVLWKTLVIEIERVFRPNVVRAMFIQGKPVDDSDELRRSVLSYFALYIIIFVVACTLLVAVEPSTTWTDRKLSTNDQMYDTVTAVATAYNCVGPSFGITGSSGNFGVFHAPAKMIYIVLMLLGRLELYILIVFFYPSFWKG